MPVAFREELDPLRPYVPPKSWRMAAEGTDDSYAKLTSNELAFGPLPEAEAALSEGQEIEPEALLSAVTDRTRAVILCNPNNPSGTFVGLEGVRGLADALPDGVVLIVDEAYREFVDDPSYEGSHTLALERDNVVMARTFSKAHGLAGLRVGYGIASERIADYAERVRFPVSVNLAAQVAATASMHAREKVTARAEFVVRERSRLQDAFRRANLEFIPSQGNFVMVRFGAADFERSGVLVREGEALGYPGWSRVTVGDSGENDRVIAALV